MNNLTSQEISHMIYTIRGQRVMLDSDLAKLYGVETRIINRNVKRNIARFPQDFMFQLTPSEFESLRSQIGISKIGRGGRKYLPFAFTEQGIAMLSSVLTNEIAIEINIQIMRIFISMRKMIASNETLAARIESLEKDSNEMKQIFQIVFNKINELQINVPILPKDRKKIGLK